MWKNPAFYTYNLLLIQVLLSGTFISFLLNKVNAKAEAVVYNMRPTFLKQYMKPQRSHPVRYLDSNIPIYTQSASMSGDVLKIDASDAIDIVKYSQPDIAYNVLNLNTGMKVPSLTISKHNLFQNLKFQKGTFPVFQAPQSDKPKPIRDMRYLDLFTSEEKSSSVTDKESSKKAENRNLEEILGSHNQYDKTTEFYQQSENNFTDANDNLISVSSDALLSYEVPATELNDSSIENSTMKLDSKTVNDYSMVSTMSSIQLNTHAYIDFVNLTNLTTEIVSTSKISDENVTNSLPSTDSENKLSSGTVAGIVIAVLVCVTLLSSAVIYLLYRKFNVKCTSIVENKFNSDNCGYLDDSLHSSIYLNNHIELPKESSEEMTSLDNDSFLNSLETMTIQNYWADSSKNTKV